MEIEDLSKLTDVDILEILKRCDRNDLIRALIVVPDDVKDRFKILDQELYNKAARILHTHEIVEVRDVNESIEKIEAVMKLYVQSKKSV